MPNYPADYKQQESYYASQEYQTAAKTAIKENKKLPKYGGPQGGTDKKKKQTYTCLQLFNMMSQENKGLSSCGQRNQ